jgi:hypothetical protein
MNGRQPRYSNEEAFRRGTEWYFKAIRPKLGPEFKDKYVAIDIDTGEYEIADDSLLATHALLARNPNADIWMQRVGHRASVSFGGQPTEDPAW